MRRPYKLFGLPLEVDKWKVTSRPDLRDVRFPEESRIPLIDARARPPNDILTQLGDTGIGCPRNIYPAIVRYFCFDGGSKKTHKNSICAPFLAYWVLVSR